MRVDAEADQVGNVAAVDVRVPLTRRLLARGRAIAAVAQLEVARRLVGDGEERAAKAS